MLHFSESRHVPFAAPTPIPRVDDIPITPPAAGTTKLGILGLDTWRCVMFFITQKKRTYVMSVVCTAFYRAASAPPKRARFPCRMLGTCMNFSFDRLRSAHARFPSLQVDLVLHGNQDRVSAVPGLRELVPELASFTSITMLTLRHQTLVRFPDSVCNALTGLQKLDLRCSRLVALPDAIGGLRELTHLNVHGNYLVSLPETLGGLTGLTELKAGGNNLTTLPASIAALVRIKLLRLNCNLFQTLPEGKRYIFLFRSIV